MRTTLLHFTCAHCGKPHSTYKATAKYCSKSCSSKSKRGAKNGSWKGGVHVATDGYVRHLTGIKKYEREHRLLAERALGHPLPPQSVVHHFNESKTDNSPGNLVLCQDRAYHNLLHARLDRLKDTGSLDLKRCSTCQEVKALGSFHVSSRDWDGRRGECKACRT